MKQLDFTIVTPSFKQLDYLACCIASVADQGMGNGGRRTEDGGQGAQQKQVSIFNFGFWILNFKRSREEKARKAGERKASDTDGQLRIEHIVQDAGSPGIEEFAEKMAEQLLGKYGGERASNLQTFELLHIRTAHGYTLRIFKEPDEGMYDAINKGLKKSTGASCAYLNSDEQYLPGALKIVRGFFEDRINVEVVLGDVIVVGVDGEAICHRKMVKPGLAHTWTCHFGALTAGIFFRKKLVNEGLLFDTTYRAVSDAEWFVRVLRKKKRIEALRKTTSTFMETGENLGLSPTAKEERSRLDASAPLFFSKLRILWVIVHRLKKLISGAHKSENVAYEIYMPKREGRNSFKAFNLRTTWPGRIFNY